jgi:branched-chain amino acid transport system substrate-binding protein
VLGRGALPLPGHLGLLLLLLQAQASRAKVVGLLMAGADMVNCIKQAKEFGLNRRARLVGTPMFITDIHGMGLEQAQGPDGVRDLYWDLNDRTRASSTG